ncbi:MAG: hypothetical protein QOK29_2503 [Rhodospirillaceae bacterium]|jgi:hypothetical protein|nr:hypothetical protein [Rhodospirillaceae bacterium]
MHRDAKDKLVDFLERRAFDPVMRAKPGLRSESDKSKLQKLQQSTRSEIERFRHYGSAREVLVNFKRDLTSSKARQIHRDLQALHLPTILDIREDFEKLAALLGVDA